MGWRSDVSRDAKVYATLSFIKDGIQEIQTKSSHKKQKKIQDDLIQTGHREQKCSQFMPWVAVSTITGPFFCRDQKEESSVFRGQAKRLLVLILTLHVYRPRQQHRGSWQNESLKNVKDKNEIQQLQRHYVKEEQPENILLLKTYIIPGYIRELQLSRHTYWSHTPLQHCRHSRSRTTHTSYMQYSPLSPFNAQTFKYI